LESNIDGLRSTGRDWAHAHIGSAISVTDEVNLIRWAAEYHQSTMREIPQIVDFIHKKGSEAVQISKNSDVVTAAES